MQLVATPQGMGVWVNVEDWKLLLKRLAVEWPAFADKAERCEVAP